MAVRKLVEVWDGKVLVIENIKFLKLQTKKVRFPINKDIKNILVDLLDTYKATPCAGVAANQIGYDKSIFVGLKHDVLDDEEKEPKKIVDNPNSDNYEFYINPQIDYFTKKSIQEGEEGCLSIPELRIIAERYNKIKVRYYNAKGEKIKKPLSGFMSRLFQHEVDHLNGVLMLENSKINKVFRISDNEKIESLYINLVQKLQKK